MNKIIKILVLVPMIFIFNCRNYETQGGLFDAIKEIDNSNIKDNIIDLKKVYGFKWDALYIFNEFVDSDDIKEIIGLDCKCDMVPDSLEMYIFVNGDKIVEKIIIENRSYYFSITEYLDFEKTIKIESKNSKFKILKNGNENYILKPI